MFEGITNHADNVDVAFLYIVGFSIVMLLGVTATMIYFVFKYSAKKHPVPIQTHGSTIVELIWVVVPTIIVISMFAYGYADLHSIRNTDNVDMEINVTAKMWQWQYKYENGVEINSIYNEFDNSVDGTLIVPVNKKIKFNITALDVLHSFYIPAMRIKEDAVPGRMHHYSITPVKTGTFDIACAEYCGTRHSQMYSKIKVVSQEEFDEWLKTEEAKLAPVKEEAVAPISDSTSTAGSSEAKN